MAYTYNALSKLRATLCLIEIEASLLSHGLEEYTNGETIFVLSHYDT